MGQTCTLSCLASPKWPTSGIWIQAGDVFWRSILCFVYLLTVGYSCSQENRKSPVLSYWESSPAPSLTHWWLGIHQIRTLGHCLYTAQEKQNFTQQILLFYFQKRKSESCFPFEQVKIAQNMLKHSMKSFVWQGMHYKWPSHLVLAWCFFLFLENTLLHSCDCC